MGDAYSLCFNGCHLPAHRMGTRATCWIFCEQIKGLRKFSYSFLGTPKTWWNKNWSVKNTWASAWILGARYYRWYDGGRFIREKRETWVAVHHSIGATDVWFAGPELCSRYRVVYTRILLIKKDLEPGHEKTLFPHADLSDVAIFESVSSKSMQRFWDNRIFLYDRKKQENCFGMCQQ